MSKKILRTLVPVAVAAALAAPLAANAESGFASTTGTGNLTVNAHADFRIVIPKFLFLQVGTNGAAIDLIDFVVPAANVGLGAIPGTGGETGAGFVTANVRGNGGDVQLSATTGGALSNGGTGTISWSQITAASTTGFVPPTLLDGATSNVTVPATGRIVNQTGQWSFTYANSAVVPDGTYGGVGVNNGRVTYTATFL
jgi:hypothetical protein